MFIPASSQHCYSRMHEAALTSFFLLPTHSVCSSSTNKPISSSGHWQKKKTMVTAEFFHSLKGRLTSCRWTITSLPRAAQEHKYTVAGIWETVGPWIALHCSKRERLQEILNDNGQKNRFLSSESCTAMFPYCRPVFRKKAATSWTINTPRILGEHTFKYSSDPLLFSLWYHVSHNRCSEIFVTLQGDLQRITNTNILNRNSILVTNVVFLKPHTIMYKYQLSFNYMSLSKTKDALVWRRLQSQVPIARWSNGIYQFWWWGVLVFCTEVINSYFCDWTHPDLEKQK